MNHVIETRNLTKTYQMGEVAVKALQGVNLTVDKGEFAAIMGASGSGKSTLLNLLGCLDVQTSGDYLLDGIDVNTLNKNDRAAIRNQKLGFVFQGFNLLARTSALENVELPLIYDRTQRIKKPKEAAAIALERVGLKDRMAHESTQLSGGEQQRVAIARSLVNQPEIIFADEPTGNLDTKTSVDIMALFQKLNELGLTLIIVTHEPDIAAYAKRIIKMQDGQIINDRPVQARNTLPRDIEESA